MKNARGKIPLAKEEWIFNKPGECKDDELKYCADYELAREVVRLCSASAPLTVHMLKNEFRSLCKLDLEIPWLKIPKSGRERFRKLFEGRNSRIWPDQIIGSIENLRDSKTGQLQPVRTETFGEIRRQRDGDIITTFVHEVAWAEGLKKNIEYFRAFWKAHKPASLGALENRGRETASEILNHLAALRLYDGYGFEEAVRISRDQSCCPFGSKESWPNARSRARSIVREKQRDFSRCYAHCVNLAIKGNLHAVSRLI